MSFREQNYMVLELFFILGVVMVIWGVTILKKNKIDEQNSVRRIGGLVLIALGIAVSLLAVFLIYAFSHIVLIRFN